jgi:acyl-coenzyme A synthetase/AMP-(fatty) acid ligase
LGKNHPACIGTTFAAALLDAAHAVVIWRLSAEELTYIVNDSTARIVVVGHEFAETFAGLASELTKPCLTVCTVTRRTILS